MKRKTHDVAVVQATPVFLNLEISIRGYNGPKTFGKIKTTEEVIQCFRKKKLCLCCP
ncbi:MAG: hypothetical protein A4E63_01706 [Syntrophorhabdus sp. PtaU1.Bin050]|nr:MAG: hypothetical protein A4E63_01706 [Syntrophorhabdus sp. PtaU1.Bin050]